MFLLGGCLHTPPADHAPELRLAWWGDDLLEGSSARTLRHVASCVCGC